VFSKILIANRGEIALRVVRSCRELGIRSVVAHSTRDRDDAAVRMADESVQIGPPPAMRSYLNAAAVLEAALRTGAEAIHPGYGFLSEDPQFVEACEGEGVVFIGPPASAMELLGGKIAARDVARATGLPLLPGSPGALGPEGAAEIARRVGFPVILKPSAGGGGRGMTVVADAAGFDESYRQAQATARQLFGDGRVYLERYLTAARHVELQVLCDGQGGAVHLGARDCTVQRRHQKLIEESPAPMLPATLIEEMGRAACLAALHAGYRGVGTFEFLLAPDGAYYFMEVNCRLQVEHPVTEMVTGIDLVAEQLRVAAGEALGFGQADIQPRGVSIECRVNAEDPACGFAPTPGRITDIRMPAGPFVRVDSHVHAGHLVPPEYDSLLAKVVVWAPDRPRAIARMRRALGEVVVESATVRTTRDFLLDVLADPRFDAAEHTTALVDAMGAWRERAA
jgi:acetyl-CoA carboxylase biotin carboxylase subunit